MSDTPDKPEHGSPAAGLPGFTHRYADVNGTTLHFVVGGSGPAVVLLHGWPLSWREWRGGTSTTCSRCCKESKHL